MNVGQRVMFYRRRRGLTQAVLAGLVGRSEDWLSKVERGERQVRRIDVLADLARALRVTLGDLLGQPALLEDEHAQDDVPAVRDALMNPWRISRVLFGSAPPEREPEPARSAALVEQAWHHYQRGRLGTVVTALPGLIIQAQQLEDAADAGGTHPGWAVSARTHHLAATALSKIGEAELGWIAAERAMQAADRSDDPLVLASAARAGAHALLAVGRYDEALALANTAARWLTPRIDTGDPAALSLLGMLHLRSAIAAARNHDRATATELLERAADAAERLGADANHWHTSFGPTNVELHRFAAALDLGDIAHVADRGPSVTLDPLPPERGASHLIDTARALSLLARDEHALDLLLRAEQVAPQLVRHSPSVRETVKALHRRAPVTGGGRSSALFALAERCRAVS